MRGARAVDVVKRKAGKKETGGEWENGGEGKVVQKMGAGPEKGG